MSNERPPTPCLLTTRDVADRLGITPRQVARLAPNRLQPAQKLPGRQGAYLFTEEAVQALEAERAA